MRILVVDDSTQLRDLVSRALTRDGHRVTAVGDIRGAEEAVEDGDVDLVVLDHALPDGWGIDWCRRARESGLDALVLVLTAHGDVAQRLDGFAAGADDFLAKPFAVAELRARVLALGRRRGAQGSRGRKTVLREGDVVVDLARRLATRAGATAPLTAREWNVIECLANAEGRVVSRADLLDEVWGANDAAAAASLEVLIARIRKKLGAQWIRTARGDGYALGVA
jgi:DNA-binding response OmpR family regulator